MCKTAKAAYLELLAPKLRIEYAGRASQAPSLKPHDCIVSISTGQRRAGSRSRWSRAGEYCFCSVRLRSVNVTCTKLCWMASPISGLVLWRRSCTRCRCRCSLHVSRPSLRSHSLWKHSRRWLFAGTQGWKADKPPPPPPRSKETGRAWFFLLCT